MLSRKGYRTVSADGELFEPDGGSMSVDFGGRITDMTKAILFLANRWKISVQMITEALPVLLKRRT